MILHRVIAHFRKQEWTAIALDFLIVVVGILLAFQITLPFQHKLNHGDGFL